MSLLDWDPVLVIWLLVLTVLAVYATAVASLAYWAPQNVLKLQV